MRLFLIYSAKKYSKSAQSSTCPPMPYVYACARTYAHICAGIYARAHTHTHTHVHVCTCVHVRAHTFRNTFTHELCTCRRCMQGHVRVRVCMRLYIYASLHACCCILCGVMSNYAMLCDATECIVIQCYLYLCVCVCMHAQLLRWVKMRIVNAVSSEMSTGSGLLTVRATHNLANNSERLS